MPSHKQLQTKYRCSVGVHTYEVTMTVVDVLYHHRLPAWALKREYCSGDLRCSVTKPTVDPHGRA